MLLISLALCSTSCKKEKTGIDGLPPATQEGKGIIGCLVNGKLLIPKGSGFGGPTKQATYQFLNGHHFIVSVSQRSDDHVFGVQVEIKDMLLAGDITIALGKENAIGGYTEYKNLNHYQTNNVHKGELKITRFDEANQIVSGTFWFDAVNEKGEKVEVREGRFDMRYTI